MRGRDHAQVQLPHRRHSLRRLLGEGHDDVREVLFGATHQRAGVHLVGEALRSGEELPERVIGEEDAVQLRIGDHVVRPMHHGGMDEAQRAAADAKILAALHGQELTLFAHIGLQDGQPFGIAGDDLGVRRRLQHARKATSVVLLAVIRDDDADLRRVHHIGHAIEQFALEARHARVDQRDLLVHDQVGIGGGAVGHAEPMDVALIPFDSAYPIDVRADLECSEHDAVLLHRASCRFAARRFRSLLRSCCSCCADSIEDVPGIGAVFEIVMSLYLRAHHTYGRSHPGMG